MRLAHNLVRNQPPFGCGEPSAVHQTKSKRPRILVSTWACVLRKKALSQTDPLILYIEKDVVLTFNLDSIVDDFKDLKERRVPFL